MPNDLTTKQNVLNLRADAHLGSRRSLDSKGLLSRGGGVAFVWTLSGVVLAACSTIEDFFGLDDDNGGGGGGNVLHVQRSPVQGARLYFDLDNDGDIDDDDVLAQDEVFPEGFVTDATGQARDIPEIFEGLPFKAVLDGAIDAETGAELSGTFDSIAAADGQHVIATPITDYIAQEIENNGGTPADVVAALLGNPDPDSEEVVSLLEAINDPASYVGGHSGIEGLAFFLLQEQEAGRTPTVEEVQAQVALLFNDDAAANDDTLIVVNADTDLNTADVIELPAVTISVNDSYIATIQAVSHTGAVQYRFVESDLTTPVSGGAFSINAQGVISVVEGQPLTDTTLYVAVSNGDADETEIVSVAITVVPPPILNPLPASDATATIVEGVAGASDAGTALISGITPAAALTNATWEIDEASPAGLDAIVRNFSIVEDGNTGTYTLVLNSGASLDYDAIPGGVLNLHVRVVEDGVRSNALALRIQVEEDPDEIDFGDDVDDVTGIVAEGGNLVARGRIRVENQPEGEDVTVSDPGIYGALVLGDNGASWTYTLNDALAAVDALLTGQVLIDTATIAVGDVTQNILIRINGLDEDVHFVDSTTARTATASVGVERGNPVLSEVDIFDGLTLTNAELADIEIDFAGTDTVYDLFTITDAGLLTFTGDNDDVAGFGSGITLDLAITAPTLTSATLPFALQVNVINEVDDGRAEYEVIGDVGAGQELRVRIVDDSADPDGVVGGVIFQWFRGDETNPTLLSIGDRYSVTQADIDSGDSIGVFAIYTDGSGTTYTYTDGDPATTIVAFASPVSFTAPAAADRTISLPENTLADGTVHFYCDGNF